MNVFVQCKSTVNNSANGNVCPVKSDRSLVRPQGSPFYISTRKTFDLFLNFA